MSIQAHQFNELKGALVRTMLQPGAGARITRLPHGQIVSAQETDRSIRHPWFCSVAVSAGKFSVTIQPGFVNGIDPTISVTNVRTKIATSVPLTETPSLLLPDFLDRTESDATAFLPPFFVALGAMRDKSQQIGITGEKITVADDSSAQSAARRRLLSADIYIAVARLAVNGSVLVVANPLGGQDVLYESSFDASVLQRYGPRPRILTTPLWSPPPSPTAAQRITEFFGTNTATDSGEDQLLLATLFLLSPAGTPEGSAPDESWTPYVQHALFFNLLYAPQTLPAEVTPTPITLYTGLAGGIGDEIDNAILAGINDASDALEQGLADSVAQTGKFWTI